MLDGAEGQVYKTCAFPIPQCFAHPTERFLRYGIANRRLSHRMPQILIAADGHIRHATMPVVVFIQQRLPTPVPPGERGLRAVITPQLNRLLIDDGCLRRRMAQQEEKPRTC